MRLIIIIGQWLIAIGLIVGSIVEERHYRKQRQKKQSSQNK